MVSLLASVTASSEPDPGTPITTTRSSSFSSPKAALPSDISIDGYEAFIPSALYRDYRKYSKRPDDFPTTRMKATDPWEVDIYSLLGGETLELFSEAVPAMPASSQSLQAVPTQSLQTAQVPLPAVATSVDSATAAATITTTTMMTTTMGAAAVGVPLALHHPMMHVATALGHPIGVPPSAPPAAPDQYYDSASGQSRRMMHTWTHSHPEIGALLTYKNALQPVAERNCATVAQVECFLGEDFWELVLSTKPDVRRFSYMLTMAIANVMADMGLGLCPYGPYATSSGGLPSVRDIRARIVKAYGELAGVGASV